MIQEGSTVKWEWGQGYASGQVEESYDHEVTKTIDGSEITRKGETNNKALLIRQDDGQRVLKLEQEVQKVD